MKTRTKLIDGFELLFQELSQLSNGSQGQLSFADAMSIAVYL